LYREVVEIVISLHHLQQFNTHDLFPIFGEVGNFEFGKEIGESHLEEAFAVNADPVLDTVIAKPREDPTHLFIFSNILGIKIASTGVLVHTHDGGRDISGQKHRYFGWSILLNCCEIGLRWHDGFIASRNDGGVGTGGRI